MESHKTTSNTYIQRLVYQESRMEKLKKKMLVISIARFVLFFTAAILTYFALTSNPDHLGWIIILLVISFLILMKYHAKLFHKNKYIQKYIELIKDEIDALEGNLEKFEDGGIYILNDKQEVHFTIDLDVFGKDSLFQHINRTVSLGGSRMLAHLLKYPEKSREKILNRQKAIAELSENIDFRQGFAATGKTVKEQAGEYKQLADWLTRKDVLLNNNFFKILIIIVPIINLTLIGLASFSVIEWIFSGFSLLSTLLFVGFYQKRINLIHQMVSRKVYILEKYKFLLKKIEQESFSSDLLKDLKEKLHNNGKTSVEITHQLSKILGALDNRLNILAGVLLNAVFIWDIQQIIRLERWKANYGKDLVVWFSVISKFDALMSFANFKYNNPEYIFPELAEEYFVMDGKNLRHPLMKIEECVPNDILLSQAGCFMVVTGANMAGKSTLLRTIGINMLLGMNGSVVSASYFRFFPADIASSLRVNDSLKKNTSYFYAEIKRLEYIINQLKSEKKVFVLLDEILRGTNSRDKEQGSKALLKQLLTLNASGLIATHDLNLAHLSEEFGNKISNQCFEVEVSGNELVFDYKLRNGTAKNLSATFLMKKMGITV